jgi:hypothetical protein
MEAKYRVMVNVRKPDGSPDWDAFKSLAEKISTEGCSKAPAEKCQCRAFQNLDSESPCSAGVYTKVLRDTEALQKYMDDDPKFTEDEAVEKKRRKQSEEARRDGDDE